MILCFLFFFVDKGYIKVDFCESVLFVKLNIIFVIRCLDNS